MVRLGHHGQREVGLMAPRSRCLLAASRRGPRRLNLRPSAMPPWCRDGSANPAYDVVIFCFVLNCIILSTHTCQQKYCYFQQRIQDFDTGWSTFIFFLNTNKKCQHNSIQFNNNTPEANIPACFRKREAISLVHFIINNSIIKIFTCLTNCVQFIEPK